MASTDPPLRLARPALGANGRRGSYLQEHQQYRAPPASESYGQGGIDSIVEGMQAAGLSNPRTISPFNGVPSPKTPPKIIDSGLNHTLSHANCQQPSNVSENRLIATLMYKTKSSQTSGSSLDPQPSSSAANIPPTFAPVRRPSAFPLEPPPVEPESLDHLYGSYISPLCLTSFLHLIDSLPANPESEDPSSSHRCLDAAEHPTIVEISILPPDPAYITLSDLRKHELLYRFEQEWNVDVIIQTDSVLRRYPRLVVFDMDSTLIEQEVIDLIAAEAGVEAQVADITSRAMNGELDFATSLRERVALLAGIDADILTRLRTVIKLTQGARELIRGLKRMGCKTAVLSGGFIPLTSWLATSLGIDYAFANTLGTAADTGKLTGQLEGPIVDAERKRALLVDIAEKEGVPLEQVVAVGDGANDLLMLGTAGLGVAWNAKPVVQMQAMARLNGDTLLDLLHVFGFTRSEIDEVTK